MNENNIKKKVKSSKTVKTILETSNTGNRNTKSKIDSNYTHSSQKVNETRDVLFPENAKGIEKKIKSQLGLCDKHCTTEVRDLKLNLSNTRKHKNIQSLQKESSSKAKTNIRKCVTEKQINKPYIEEDLAFEEIEKKIFNITQQELTKSKNYNPKSKKNKNENSQSTLISKNKYDKSSYKSSSSASNSTNDRIKKSKSTSQSGTIQQITNKKSSRNKQKNIKIKENESNSEMSDWEQVDELSEILDSIENSKCPGNDVQIELESSNMLWGIKNRKRCTKQEMIEDYFRKERNKSIREVWKNMHKTHLLCLLAHGMYINTLLGSHNLLASALSIIPKSYFSPKRLDLNHLQKFVTWFCKQISVANTSSENNGGGDKLIEKELELFFETKCVSSNQYLVYMFVAVTRAIGMLVRVVKCLTPISWKPRMDSLIKTNIPKVNEVCNKLNKATSEILTSKQIIHKNESPKMVNSANKRVSKRKSVYSDGNHSEQTFDLKNMSKDKEERKRKKSLDSKAEKKKKQKKESLTDWAEIYVEEEEKWIAVDISRNKIHCVPEIEARCSNAAYIVAFNPDQTAKDVTKRYASSWLSSKDKVQCDGNWWIKTLHPYKPTPSRREREEDKELEENLITQPLPKTVSEYKNHPMYALQRHLLKFESIYPPDAGPIGFVKGEPVFSRDNVRLLCGRENWIKEAKTVRLGEEPYKVVKSRPKWDKSTGHVVKDRPLELFGEWQVEDYEPPIATNGKVPRNEYGNVDLFKPCMVPRGCVHLPLSGLGRVARKLELDCAPAVVGFEFHSGGSHPVVEGFVVCEEFKDVLVDAWNQDQFEQAKKEEERRIKKIYDNWKKLIKGLTLKDMIKEKYGVIRDERGKSKAARQVVSNALPSTSQQETVEVLPPSLITHPVVNLKIDLSTPVAQGMRNKGARSRAWQKRKEGNEATGGSVRSGVQSALSSDSDEEQNGDAKRAKIRSILQWHPKCSANASTDSDEGHELSDQTDDGDGGKCFSPIYSLTQQHLRQPSIGQSRLGGGRKNSKQDPKTKKQKQRKQQQISTKATSRGKKGNNTLSATGQELCLSSSSHSDSDNVRQSPRKERRKCSLRSATQRISEVKAEASNEEGSEADISLNSESDTNDKTYDPLAS